MKIKIATSNGFSNFGKYYPEYDLEAFKNF